MTESKEDNIYIYKEDEPDKESYVYKDDDPLEDDSPLNYANPEGEEEIEANEEEVEQKSAASFRILLEIMFNPIQGWKRLRRSHMKVEKFQASCFYPILALLALSKFSDYFYYVNVSLQSIVSQAVVAFVSYFFGYFVIILLLTKFLPKNTVVNFEGEFGKNYIVAGLTTLAIFSIIINLLPMLWPVLIFLPLWTLYLLYKGSRFFKMAESQELRFMVSVCGAVIGVPLLIDWGLNQILPY